MAGNGDKDIGSVVRTQRLLLLAFFVGFALLSIPWLGVGYCVFVGGVWCPAISLPTQVARDASPDRETQTAERPPELIGPPGSSRPVLVSTARNLPTANPKYVALVIGNSKYAPPNALANPRNDATAVAAKLKGLNYTLVGGGAQFEVGKIKFEELLLAFEELADKAEVALIYYAGHGVEDRGENFLIPVDAKLERRASLKAWGLPLTRVSAALPKGDNQYGVIILDACRTSNFLLVGDDGKQRSVGQRGLIVQKVPGRALIAYSASAGEAAADGDGVNSPYVESLVQHMSPDVDIKTVFARVQDDLRKSKWAQRPDTSDQIGDKKVAFAPEPPPPPPGTEFRDCDVVCPLMVVVPKGKFLMGAPTTEKDSNSRERPQHNVTIARDFAVGKFEVTFEEWDACVAAQGCRDDVVDNGWGRGRKPVIWVSWFAAQKYVGWLVKRTGKQYRLLSEAEWEYAARAGTTTAYPWGTKASLDYANFCIDYGHDPFACENFRRPIGQPTSPVGSFRPNGFGLFDMHGNVAEWVEDCLTNSYNGATPLDGSAYTGMQCNYRGLRGGSWNSSPRETRSAFREFEDLDGGGNTTGFRVARTL